MESVGVVVVGAGAAGLMAGIAAAGESARVVALDSQAKLGAKILVSGGGRCNVTNHSVAPHHFHGGPQPFIASVLRRYPNRAVRAFFEGRGVPLKVEETGKLFPVSDSARDVLAALLAEASRVGLEVRRQAEVRELKRGSHGRYRVRTPNGDLEAASVILCTGGLALPRSGSRGAGYEMASALGHRLVPTSPALTPLVGRFPRAEELSGVSLHAALRLHPRSGKRVDYTGSFLFTHFGYSGPAVLNISRHWIREGSPPPALHACFLPGTPPEEVREWLLKGAREHPRQGIVAYLAQRIPRSLARGLECLAGLPEGRVLGELTRPERAALLAALTDCALPLEGHRGYAKAEATAGGVPLEEVDPETLQSQLSPGLFLAGEVMDVDGMLGGYNFQWAWSSGVVAGRAAARYALGQSPE